MRVLVACDWFLKYAASQVSALRRAGADVALLCRSHALEFHGSEGELKNTIEALDGVPVYQLTGRISAPGSVRQTVRLRETLRQWSPDVVHAHDNADPRLLAIVSGMRRVVTVHDPVPHPGQPSLSWVEGRVRRRWITGADALVVHGAQLADELPHWARRRPIWPIPHGAAVRDVPCAAPATPAVLLFGRLEPYKGVDVLVRAMQRVWERVPSAKLIVAGVGPASDDVPNDPRIELEAHYVPEEGLDALFGRASLVALPYVQASQSGVGSLAIGRGVPVVVSDVGALRDLAVDESFVVPPNDDVRLADAIVEHLGHDEAVRERVLAFARSTVSWDTCARESLRVYELVIAGTR